MWKQSPFPLFIEATPDDSDTSASRSYRLVAFGTGHEAHWDVAYEWVM